MEMNFNVRHIVERSIERNIHIIDVRSALYNFAKNKLCELLYVSSPWSYNKAYGNWDSNEQLYLDG